MNIKIVPVPNPDPFAGFRKEINALQILTGNFLLAEKDAKKIWRAYSESQGSEWEPWNDSITLFDLCPFFTAEIFQDPAY